MEHLFEEQKKRALEKLLIGGAGEEIAGIIEKLNRCEERSEVYR